MVVNFLYRNTYKQQAPDGTTYFVMNGYRDNFNDTTVIAESTSFGPSGIWNHSELHFTRMGVVYTAAAAGAQLTPYISAGKLGGATVADFPTGCSEVTTGAKKFLSCSGPMDIVADPRLDGQAASYFAQCVVAGFNAADDMTIHFAGWYRDSVPQTLEMTEPKLQPVSLDRATAPIKVDWWPFKK